jgi:hypothetical protein
MSCARWSGKQKNSEFRTYLAGKGSDIKKEKQCNNIDLVLY